MDKPIGVGDLTVRVRSCCGVYVGTVKRVEGFSNGAVKCVCDKCGRNNGEMVKAYFVGNELPSAAPLPYLKRIPPLSELEIERTEDEVTA